ncbi:MAG: PQQ-binding-like beta-propeller repeat protein [Caldiserica bacterium]|nr:PQQ-binding-like beta-propeller repeat protein [Caldisericota bacterium]
MRKTILMVAVATVVLCGCTGGNSYVSDSYRQVASTNITIPENGEFLNTFISSSGKYAVFISPYLMQSRKPTLYCVDLDSGKLLWTKDIVIQSKVNFAVFGDAAYAVVNSRLVKIDLSTGKQSNVTEEKVESLVEHDEDSIYCTQNAFQRKENEDYKFDFHCLSFNPKEGKLNWNTKIDMNYGSVLSGKSIITIFTTNTVDKKFAVLDKATGKVLRYEPISSRKQFYNLDDRANVIFFHDNAVRMNTDSEVVKLIDYDKLTDWADVGGMYYKGELYIWRKNGQIQKLDTNSGKPKLVIELGKAGRIRFDNYFNNFISTQGKAFELISADNGETVAQMPLAEPIKTFDMTKNEFIIQTTDKKIVIANKMDMSIKQTIDTEKKIINLVGSETDLFGVVFEDGQYAIYSAQKH